MGGGATPLALPIQWALSESLSKATDKGKVSHEAGGNLCLSELRRNLQEHSGSSDTEVLF
jgi:hypothetical protein